jgi:hypothetical protein
VIVHFHDIGEIVDSQCFSIIDIGCEICHEKMTFSFASFKFPVVQTNVSML